MLDLNKVYNLDCKEGLRQIDDNSIDLVVTSPPYNIGIDYDETYNDNKEEKEYFDWLKQIFIELYRVIKDKGLVVINVGNQRNSGLPHHIFFLLKEVNFVIQKEIFWYKGLYYIQGETIFVCSKSKDYHCYYKTNDGFYSNGQFATIWEMRYTNGESKTCLNHNAFFVKKLPTNFIKINTKEGDVVLDPFMGSGTTAVSAKQLNRNYIGFEINPNYVEVSNERLSQKTLFENFGGEQ